jgi:hypothetical protein
MAMMPALQQHFPGQTGAGHSSPGGPTIEAIAAALEALGFAVEPPLSSYTSQAEIEMLAGLIEWDAGQTRIQEWLDDRRDALNEDLARILLG